MIDSKKLRHFKTVAEEGNFNDAAVLLHLSQPALSRSIQSLEDSLKLKLFDRSQRAIKLTLAGQQLLKHACSVLLEIENIEREADKFNSLISGKLNIGTGPLPADHIAARACARFIEQYPNINISLQVEDPTYLAPKLVNGDIDILLADPRVIIDQKHLEFQPLPEVPAVLVARKGHPLASKMNVTLNELQQYPLGIISKLGKQIVGKALGISSQEDINSLFSYECNSTQLLLTTVKFSDTISILMEDNVIEPISRNEVSLIDVPAISNHLTSQYAIVTFKPRLLSLAAEKYIEIVHQVSKDNASNRPFKF